MATKYKYVSVKTSAGVLTLEESIYNYLKNEHFKFDVRLGMNPQIRRYEKGINAYYGTLKAYVEDCFDITIKSFADGNRMNFKLSNLITE